LVALQVDHYVIHSRMKCHAMRGDLAGVTQAKEDMEAGGVASNERTFSVLVLSLLQCGQTHKAELLLRNALSRRLYIHDSLFMAFLRHYAAAQDLQGVQDVFQVRGLAPTSAGLPLACSGCPHVFALSYHLRPTATASRSAPLPPCGMPCCGRWPS
jgi:hypothetical protein